MKSSRKKMLNLPIWTTLIVFYLSGCHGDAYLEILPSQPVLTKPVGKSVLFTCKTKVDDPSLVSDFKWLDIKNRTIDRNNLYTRDRFTIDTIPADKALALIIQPLHKNDAGTYTCTAKYANSKTLTKTVTLTPIVAVTWEDAPTEQYPLSGKNYRVKCKVKADPPPHVEWKINSQPLDTSNSRYVVETDGLVVQGITEADDGIYTCRAFVIDTGELTERNIKVEVHTPPKFIEQNMTTSLEAVDGESASLQCVAEGKPRPRYAWIKANSQLNLVSAERFAVNELTGVLSITRVSKDDSGELKCVASNGAGSVERSVRLLVIVKPQVQQIRNISIVTEHTAKLECRATGNPLPAITFRKLSNPKRMIAGVQMEDDRIIVEQREDREKGQAVGTLIIQTLMRKDDGLYECIATNKGGEDKKNGHITVEFSPTFEHSPMKEAWSWNRRAVNLTCLAEAIPNATISWRLNERIIDKDPNFIKFGSGPSSTLTVHPVDQRFYGIYKCMATNPYGEDFHEINLREAHYPGEITDSKAEIITATTITFKLFGPNSNGGRPIKAMVVEYKKDTEEWMQARNKSWPIEIPYILEDLEPQTVYIFRFAALNEVGLGSWGASMSQTMPKRSSPEDPIILNTQAVDGTVVSQFSDRFELRWKKPADNGEYIDKYSIRYCPVKKEIGGWQDKDDCNEIELRTPEKTSYDISELNPNSFYRLELRAHNAIGFSSPSQIYLHTAHGEDSMKYHHENHHITSSVLIGAVVAALVIILIIIDVSCYFVNDTGLLYLICGKKKTSQHKGKKQDDLKQNSEGKELLTNGNRDAKIRIESQPMLDNGYNKRDTTVEYDVKKSVSRTSFVGKDSAV